MFCTNCGKELSDSARFCNMCGTAVAASRELPPGDYNDIQPFYQSFGTGEELMPPQPDTPWLEEPVPAVPAEKRRKGFGRLLWLIALLLVLALAAGAVWILANRDGSRKPSRREASENGLTEEQGIPVSLEEAYPDGEWDGLVLWHYEDGQEPFLMDTALPELTREIWREILETQVKETEKDLSEAICEKDYFSLYFYEFYAEDTLTLTVGEKGTFFVEYGGEIRYFTSGQEIYDQALALLPQEEAIALGEAIAQEEWTSVYLMGLSQEGTQQQTVSLTEADMEAFLDRIAELEIVFGPDTSETGQTLCFVLSDHTGNIQYVVNVKQDSCYVPVGAWKITCQVEGLYEIVRDILAQGGIG